MSEDIKIEHYETDHVANPYPDGEMPWQVYHAVRNSVFRCCREFGRVGVMGECPITTEKEIPLDDWPLGDEKPLDFFVIDDQLNNERYIYLEIVKPAAFTREWLVAIMRSLTLYPAWGVGVGGFKDAYMLAFEEKLMLVGKTFAKCNDLESVLRCGQFNLSNSVRLRK